MSFVRVSEQAAVRRALLSGLYQNSTLLAARLLALYRQVQFAEDIARSISASAAQAFARRALMDRAYCMHGKPTLSKSLALISEWESNPEIPDGDRFDACLAVLILQSKVRRRGIASSGQVGSRPVVRLSVVAYSHTCDRGYQGSYFVAAKSAAIHLGGVLRRYPVYSPPALITPKLDTRPGCGVRC